MNKLPIKYDENAFSHMAEKFDLYWEGLPWVDKVAPRKECFVAKFPVAYSYGVPEYARTYHSDPIPDFMLEFWKEVEEVTGYEYELCFCNGYDDERNHLGWHADDSDSVDDSRSILVVSIGAEREIMFRDNERTFTESLKLKNGSGLWMLPGMQDTHQHRIPKCGYKCGPRVSFTFRGLAKTSE
jgi:Alkylated DNA repair protein